MSVRVMILCTAAASYLEYTYLQITVQKGCHYTYHAYKNTSVFFSLVLSHSNSLSPPASSSGSPSRPLLFLYLSPSLFLPLSISPYLSICLIYKLSFYLHLSIYLTIYKYTASPNTSVHLPPYI